MIQWIKSLSVTIQMKAAEQNFLVVLFNLLSNHVSHVLTFPVGKGNSTVIMKATEQCTAKVPLVKL